MENGVLGSDGRKRRCREEGLHQTDISEPFRRPHRYVNVSKQLDE